MVRENQGKAPFHLGHGKSGKLIIFGGMEFSYCRPRKNITFLHHESFKFTFIVCSFLFILFVAL